MLKNIQRDKLFTVLRIIKYYIIRMYNENRQSSSSLIKTIIHIKISYKKNYYKFYNGHNIKDTAYKS